MIGKKLIIILFSIIIILTTFSQIVISSTDKEKNDKKMITGYAYSGFVIGRIKDLKRFYSLAHMTCQAVNVYWSITWLPPHYPHTESRWIDSGEIEIYRPVSGIVLRNFIFVHIDWVVSNKIPNP